MNYVYVLVFMGTDDEFAFSTLEKAQAHPQIAACRGPQDVWQGPLPVRDTRQWGLGHIEGNPARFDPVAMITELSVDASQ